MQDICYATRTGVLPHRWRTAALKSSALIHMQATAQISIYQDISLCRGRSEAAEESTGWSLLGQAHQPPHLPGSPQRWCQGLQQVTQRQTDTDSTDLWIALTDVELSVDQAGLIRDSLSLPP